jgi:hypothetical protein
MEIQQQVRKWLAAAAAAAASAAWYALVTTNACIDRSEAVVKVYRSCCMQLLLLWLLCRHRQLPDVACLVQIS